VPARARAYLGVESTDDNVESKAELCQEVLVKILNATAKKIRICARSTRWWTSDVKGMRSQLGSEKRSRRRSAARTQAQVNLQKSIQRAKDRMWNN